MIHEVQTKMPASENFKACHQVLKRYKSSVLENDFRGHFLEARLKFYSLSLYVAFYCQEHRIFFGTKPGFNFGPFLFLYPNITAELINLIQEVDNVEPA